MNYWHTMSEDGESVMLRGFLYSGHRALNDVDALLHLLSHGYMRPLLDAAKRTTYIVRAVGSPFATKDALKARGYTWAAEERVWWTEVDDATPEIEWLAGLYVHARRAATVTRVSPWERFAPGMVPR